MCFSKFMAGFAGDYPTRLRFAVCTDFGVLCPVLDFETGGGVIWGDILADTPPESVSLFAHLTSRVDVYDVGFLPKLSESGWGQIVWLHTPGKICRHKHRFFVRTAVDANSETGEERRIELFVGLECSSGKKTLVRRLDPDTGLDVPEYPVKQEAREEPFFEEILKTVNTTLEKMSDAMVAMIQAEGAETPSRGRVDLGNLITEMKKFQRGLLYDRRDQTDVESVWCGIRAIMRTFEEGCFG